MNCTTNGPAYLKDTHNNITHMQKHRRTQTKQVLTSMSICSFIKHKHSIFYLQKRRERKHISEVKSTRVYSKNTLEQKTMTYIRYSTTFSTFSSMYIYVLSRYMSILICSFSRVILYIRLNSFKTQVQKHTLVYTG